MSYIKDKDIELVRIVKKKLEKRLGDFHIWRIYNPNNISPRKSSPIYQDYELIGDSEEGGFLIATTVGSIKLSETWIVEGWKSESMDGIFRRL